MNKVFASIFVFLCVCISTAAQIKKDNQFYEPNQLKLSVAKLKPSKIEFREISFSDGKEQLDAYRYLTIDHVQSFGRKQLLINWEGLTAFGTGMDYNLVSAEDLSLYLRITPRGIPLGYFLESHAFPKEANIIGVNPDADFHPELKGLSSSTKSIDQRTTQKLPFDTYNSIIFPYVFATMKLYPGKSLILAEFGPYLGGLFYYRVNVIGKTKIKDAKGKSHRVYEIEGIRRRTLKEAERVSKSDTGSRTTYYVSHKAPYFFGKESYLLNKDGSKTITRRLLLNRWEFLKVSRAKRQLEMIEEWKKIKKERSLKIPWHKPKN